MVTLMVATSPAGSGNIVDSGASRLGSARISSAQAGIDRKDIIRRNTSHRLKSDVSSARGGLGVNEDSAPTRSIDSGIDSENVIQSKIEATLAQVRFWDWVGGGGEGRVGCGLVSTSPNAKSTWIYIRNFRLNVDLNILDIFLNLHKPSWMNIDLNLNLNIDLNFDMNEFLGLIIDLIIGRIYSRLDYFWI